MHLYMEILAASILKIAYLQGEAHLVIDKMYIRQSVPVNPARLVDPVVR